MEIVEKLDLEVTSEKAKACYLAYEKVRRSGMWNMFDSRAIEASGLTTSEYLWVMNNYTELNKLYNEEV